MLTSVERLRIGLLVGSGLLVAVIGGFLEYAHYRTHRIIHDLPGRLGATITKEFGAYTYSQSLQGKTVFTIHAAQAVQHKDGNYTLHDVNMVMYGRKGDRADHISGSQFEYDQKSGLVHAVGVVHLDLQTPPAAGDTAKPRANRDGAANDRVIHITTSGLVYSQKASVATTDQEIEFSFAGLTGRALGAEYNSSTGHVVLQSAVEVSGIERGQPVLLRATHAEMDRQTELATLENARYSSAAQTAAADEGVAHLRPDGSVERIVGDRHVRLEQAGEGVVTSDHGDVTLTAQSKPETAVFTGAVHYVDDEPLRQARGDARQATLHFNAAGKLEHAVLRGQVRSSERVRPQEQAATQPWSTRELSAETVDLALGSDADGHTLLQDATAVGGARLTTVAAAASRPEIGAKTGAGPISGGTSGITTSKLSGDRLQAHFVAAGGRSEVSTVHGAGHTVLEQIAATGVDQVSAGDTLEVNFREAKRGAGAVEVAHAVQQGNVAMTRTVPAVLQQGATGPDVQHAVAQRADYEGDAGDGDANRLILTGAAQVTDAQSVLWANRVVMQQGSGDATAEGAVKVTYLQQPANGSSSANAQPVHVLAERAEMEHDAGRATFYGASGGTGRQMARMWQSGATGEGGSQVEAPVLVFEQKGKRLTARGADGGAAMAVHTVLVSAPHGNRSGGASGGSGGSSASQPGAAKRTSAHGAVAGAGNGTGLQGSGPQVIRVTSREMVYTDAARQAEFTGGVRVLDTDGELRAQQATVYLQPAGSKTGAAVPVPAVSVPATAAAADAAVLGGQVDHIVATGQVEMTQPGRRATGERLVYTASDQMFVLTGTKAAPPKVVDAQQGTATGTSLRFHSGDDSVVISGARDGTSGQRARTQTKVKE